MATTQWHAKDQVLRGLSPVAMTTQVTACTPTVPRRTPGGLAHTLQTLPLSGP